LFFIGMVKTAKFCPKSFLQKVPMETRGESLAVTAVKDGVELIGVAWNEPGKPDKPRKLLVATCGTTLAGEPCCRTRYRNDPETGETTTFVREVPRCEDVETYTDYCGAIDRFNRDRQDGFRLERMVEVKNWVNHMLTSFIGYVGTNAFKAAKLEGNASNMNDFMHTLALELLTNEYDGSKFPAALKKTQAGKLSAREFVGRERPREGQAPWTALYQEGMTLRHNFAKVGTLTAAQGRCSPKGTCRICRNSSAHWYCVSCTERAPGHIAYVCGPGSGNNCMSWHCQLIP